MMNIRGNPTPTVVCKDCEHDLEPVMSDLPLFEGLYAPDSKSLDYLAVYAIMFLQTVCYNCSRKLIREHIRNGYRIAHTVYTGGRFKSLQEICEFSWYLTAKAAAKNSAFISGAWQLEDPDYYLFNALSEYGYSRTIGGYMLPERIRFGSTHVLPFIKLCTKEGVELPEKDKVIILKDGKKAIGYEQIGIDIIPDNDLNITLGLIKGKKHILIGKVPPKSSSINKNYIFYKIEAHGTKGFKSKLQHAADLVEYIVKPRKDPVDSRRENALDKYVKPFNKIIKSIEQGPEIVEFTDIQKNRKKYKESAKSIGLSFMVEFVEELEKVIRELLSKEHIKKEESAFLRDVYLKVKGFIDTIASKPELDHLETRFGEEVILSMEVYLIIIVYRRFWLKVVEQLVDVLVFVEIRFRYVCIFM